MGKKIKVIATLKPTAYDSVMHNVSIKRFIKEPVELVLSSGYHDEPDKVKLDDNPTLKPHISKCYRKDYMWVLDYWDLDIIMEIPYDSSNS